MSSLRGVASWTTMMSLVGELTAPACHPTKFANKAESQTFLSTNIDGNSMNGKNHRCCKTFPGNSSAFYFFARLMLGGHSYIFFSNPGLCSALSSTLPTLFYFAGRSITRTTWTRPCSSDSLVSSTQSCSGQVVKKLQGLHNRVTRGPYYRIFYGRNLPIFVIS